MENREIIQVQGLCKQFGEIQAVDHLDFTVREGEIFGFLGPNGAGKTTTIRMLVGLLRPDSGSAWVDGYEVEKDPVRAKKSVGVVPEASNLYGELSAVENLVYMAQLYGVPRSQWQPRAEELLKEFNLLDRKEGKFQGFSRGMKRRLTIAAALVHRPRVLFLDEPTTGLDVMSARGLRSVIRGLKAKGGDRIPDHPPDPGSRRPLRPGGDHRQGKDSNHRHARGLEGKGERNGSAGNPAPSFFSLPA